jgi:hypothetical protein
MTRAVYDSGWVDASARGIGGETSVQSAQPRDVGVLVLVIGLFLTLFVVTLLVGGPVR